jgi:GxxExxY protein
MSISADELNKLSNVVIGAAIEVHRLLGPGLLESAYQQCLAWELGQHGLVVRQQVTVPLRYKQLQIENGYRVDMLVEGEVIVELKSVDGLLPIHTAQLLTYLKLTGLRLGLLLNFKVDVMRSGIKRVANGLQYLCVTLRLCGSRSLENG